MATTAVFAEILLVGVQALIWMALAAGVVLGPERLAALDWAAIDSWAGLLSLVVLGIAYAAGVVVDRLADSFFDRVLAPRLLGPRPDGNGKRRLYVRHHGGDMTTFLDYVRSRVRITRSTAFNLLLITLFGTWLVPDGAAKLLVACVGLSAFGLTIFAWVRIDSTWNDRLGQAYAIARESVMRDDE
jgi:hypothetical protein